MTDDRLVEVMRAFVTATNRVQNLSGRETVDLRALESAEQECRDAGTALQEALVERGWRRPTY